jgi:ATP-dependent DNA helicase RecG
MSNALNKSIGTLKGVGKKRREIYEKIGVNTPNDLIYRFPRSYIDFTQTVSLEDADGMCVVRGKVKTKTLPFTSSSGLTIYKAYATDDETDFIVIYFNNLYAFDALCAGMDSYFYGKVTVDMKTGLKQIAPREVVPASGKSLLRPIYRLTDGLTSAMVQSNVKDALELAQTECREFLTFGILEEHRLCGLLEALENIHFPTDNFALEKARRRLAFDEMLLLQLGLLSLKAKNNKKTPYRMTKVTEISAFLQSLPFELTGAQSRAIDEIMNGLCGEMPMNRLLQGDVGSGKTAVAAAACYFTHKNGYQSALMAPTEILASQHFETLKSFLEPLGINVCYLSGSLTAKKKTETRAEIESGSADVIVGTHAIFQKDVIFKNLALVITDEQHRFGVAQRSLLAEKGGSPHKLVMSATPIPRTLGLIIYGDLDISVLDEMPKGRLKIDTFGINTKARKRVYDFLKQQIAEGRQAYIICPAVNENVLELESVTQYALKLCNSDFYGYKVGVVHGRMSSSDKEKAMSDFKDGTTQILIATTVVEVGVDVPNATVIMIENAERFGFSQLHQLRGRVGRGVHKSYCVLATDVMTDSIREKFQLMSEISDGFKLAEEDMRIRGTGEFFGKKQHGLPAFRIADLANDPVILNMSSSTAKKIIASDPNLTLPEHDGLRTKVMQLFADTGDNAMN